MLITHDLGVVAGVADRVLVMYAGRQAELGTVDEIFYEPSHPYTKGLLASLPRLDRRYDERAAAPHQGPAAVVDLPADRVLVPPPLPVRRPRRMCVTVVPSSSCRRRARVGVPLREDARRAHDRRTTCDRDVRARRPERRFSRSPTW